MKKTTAEPDQRDHFENNIPKPFKFVKDDIKTVGWQGEELARSNERKMLKDLLSSEQVLQVLKPKLIDEIQGPLSILVSASNMLEGIYGSNQLLHEVEFVA